MVIGVVIAAAATLAGLTARAQDTRSTAPAATAADAAGDWVELHRLRFVNQKDGAIQVSTDQGVTWRLLGRVSAPATTVAEGYLAANYADPGTVSATSVHGHRIRVGGINPALHSPLLLAINPREYGGPVNKGYGGHRAGAAGIVTDIPAGKSVFRNLAPLVGNPIYVEGASGRLLPLPETFRPEGKGEALVIVVRRPRNPLVEVVFENRSGGAVTGRFADGATRRLTTVTKPVIGTGRFDGTSYTGVGRINTAHTGVITVGTAPNNAPLPEGQGSERRGGFQITPAWHNARTEEAGAPITMIVGQPGGERKRDLEGLPPLYRDMIGLASPDGGAGPTEGIVEVSVDGGKWEPMPTLVGLQLNSFTGPGLTRAWKAQKKKRTARQGVTAFRLRLPTLTREDSDRVAVLVADAYNKSRLSAARAGRLPLVTGQLTINANPTDAKNVSFVRILVEGVPKGVTNRPPFTLSWDTTYVPDGEYLVEAEALDASGGVITSTRRLVFVHNRVAPQAVTPRAEDSPVPAVPRGQETGQ